jgi:hypothetical protein
MPVLYIFVLEQMASEEMPKPWTPAAPARAAQDRIPEVGQRSRPHAHRAARRPA